MDPKQAHIVSQWKHDTPLNCCRFDPQGRYVFTGSEDDRVERFSLKDGKRVDFTGGHETWVRGLATSPDGKFVISGGCEGNLTWWQVAGDQGVIAHQQSAHQGWIRSVDTSPDGKWVASGGNDNRVKIWNTADAKLQRELKWHDRHVYNVRFHPNSQSLFSGDLMGKLVETDLGTGKVKQEFDAKDLHTYHKGQQTDFGGVRGIAINPARKLVAAGGTYKGSNPFGAIHEPLVLLFNSESGKLEKKLIAPGITKGVLWRLVWLNPETLCGVCGGGSGGFLIFWNLKSEKDFHRFKLPNLARDMDVHPDGIQIATAHYDRQVRITKLAPKAAKKA